jgi:hypothetical protein
MKGRDRNSLSYKNPISNSNHSLKNNNRFKKSSVNQYNKKIQNNNQNITNNINNNIYLNLLNKFNNNTSSSHKNTLGQKNIMTNQINNSYLSKEKNNLNIFEVPSSSSIKEKKNFYHDHTSLIKSMNIIDNHGNINIRLNLKNQFINNTNKNHKNIVDTNYGFDIAGIMKEKDLKIIELQNDLLKSQEIINNLQIINNNNSDIKKYNYLNKSSHEKNFLQLTRSSESVDKIINTAFNSYSSNIIDNNNITKKKSSRKSSKNSFLKKCGNKNVIKNLKYSNIKEKNDRKQSARNNNNGYFQKKQSDYLRLFLPLSNSNNDKPIFNSYFKNNKNKSYHENNNKTEKNNIYFSRKIEDDIKRNEEFLLFVRKCEELKVKTKNLVNKYIDLGDFLYKSQLK